MKPLKIWRIRSRDRNANLYQGPQAGFNTCCLTGAGKTLCSPGKKAATNQNHPQEAQIPLHPPSYSSGAVPGVLPAEQLSPGLIWAQESPQQCSIWDREEGDTKQNYCCSTAAARWRWEQPQRVKSRQYFPVLGASDTVGERPVSLHWPQVME